MRTAAAILLGLLLARAAAGAPVEARPGEDDPGRAHREALIRARAKARTGYQQMRETRRKALEDAAAAYVPGSSPAVPGWRDESLEIYEPPSATMDLPEPVAVASGRLIVLIVAAGVIAILGFRIAAPCLFHLRILPWMRHAPGLQQGRGPEANRPASGGAMTMTLKPRAERGLRNRQYRDSSHVR